MEAIRPEGKGEAVAMRSVADFDTVSSAQSLESGASIIGQPNRRRAAEKLRERGWSYRRIAQDLSIPYIIISRWLSGDTTVPVARPPLGRDVKDPPPIARPPLGRDAKDPPPVARPPLGRDVKDPPPIAVAPVGPQAPEDPVEKSGLQRTGLEGAIRTFVEELIRSRFLKADGTEAQSRIEMEGRIASLEATVESLQDQVRRMAGGAPAAPAPVPVLSPSPAPPVAMPQAEAPDPFQAMPAPDPFAQGAPDAAPDPFAEVEADPFAEPASSPTSDEAGTDRLSDPFDAQDPLLKKSLTDKLKFWKR